MRTALRIYVPERGIEVYDRVDWWKGSSSETFSQYGQDIYVKDHLFPSKSNGTFVDVGGNHPIDCNNSFLLEKNGWTGLAVEPQTSLNRLWHGKRTTECVDCVIGHDDGEVEFVEAVDDEHGHSGVAGYNNVNNKKSVLKKKQRRLGDLLRERNILDVDVLFIDVEGYEMHVLEGIDLTKIKVKCIILENDRGFESLGYLGRKIGRKIGSNTIRRYLSERNYKHVARVVSDDVFMLAKAHQHPIKQSVGVSP